MPTDILTLRFSGIQIGEGRPVQPESFSGTSSFGWIGTTNNANTFHPGITAADVVPKPEDFIDIPFRLLTSTIVGGGSWKATTFTKEVLKPSVKMLTNKPVFPDHDQDVMNWVGLVVDPYWEDEQVVDGVLIPSGINGMFRLDAKTNPKLVRAVLMNGIYSDSVTVAFDWEPSHVYDDKYKFYDMLGSFDKDGKMVTRVAKKILDYHEASLVWLGADPFAKKLDEKGNPTNVDSSNVYYSKVHTDVKTKYEEDHKFTIDCELEENILSYSKVNIKKSVSLTQEKPVVMDKFLAAFLAAYADRLGFKVDLDKPLTPEQDNQLAAFVATLVAEQTPPSSSAAIDIINLFSLNDKGEEESFVLPTEKTDYIALSRERVKELQEEAAKVSSLTKEAEFGKVVIAERRTECVRLYKLANPGKEQASMVELIQSCTPEQLTGFLSMYGREVGEQFTAQCSKCGNSEVELRSSFTSSTDKKDGQAASSDASSMTTSEAYRDKYAKKQVFITKSK